jgi:hypothetical protein
MAFGRFAGSGASAPLILGFAVLGAVSHQLSAISTDPDTPGFAGNHSVNSDFE